MPWLEREGPVFVLNLDADENRFHPAWIETVDGLLDEIDAAPAPRALVTLGTGKFWSTGLDLVWSREHPDRYASYIDSVHALLARTLASSTTSVAALNGHAFGAGAMWALAHDMRVMRVDRGWFCLPEVDIEAVFQPAMAALITARLAPPVAHEAMTFGRRYDAEAAARLGIVEATANVDELGLTAIATARSLAGKSTSVRGEIKETIYAETLAALREPTRS